jgi:hypothetical protein
VRSAAVIQVPTSRRRSPTRPATRIVAARAEGSQSIGLAGKKSDRGASDEPFLTYVNRLAATVPIDWASREKRPTRRTS